MLQRSRRAMSARWPRCWCAAPADADDKLKAVASISIIGDLVKNVGGDRVEVATLVGPNSDAHVFSPTPTDARTLGAAKIVFVNGMGLEGWMTRLVAVSGAKLSPIEVTTGVKPRQAEEARPPRGRSARLAVRSPMPGSTSPTSATG